MFKETYSRNIKDWRIVKRLDVSRLCHRDLYFPQVHMGIFTGWVDAGDAYEVCSTVEYQIKCYCKEPQPDKEVVVWKGT